MREIAELYRGLGRTLETQREALREEHRLYCRTQRWWLVFNISAAIGSALFGAWIAVGIFIGLAIWRAIDWALCRRLMAEYEIKCLAAEGRCEEMAEEEERL